MASKFLERLAEGPLLCDGGYYLELERRCVGSVETGGVPMAILDHPEGVLELHREFARAGAEVLQAMAWGVKEFDRDEELHRTAVQLAREAAGPDRFVAGTLSSCLVRWSRRSPITKEERSQTQKFFERRVGQQVAAGVDLFIIETFLSVEEAALGIPFVKEAGIPAVVTLEYTSGDFTCDRYLPGEAAKRLVDYGADVVGVNCARPWSGYRQIVREMMAAASVPICTQPVGYVLEQGEEYTHAIAAGASVHVDLRYQTRRAMADYARDAWDMGVKLIGSCCGSLPYHVRAMAEAIGKPTGIPDRPSPYRLK